MEIWKDIEGYENKYQVSNLGNVKSYSKFKNGELLKQGLNTNGYFAVNLHKNGKYKRAGIHLLVWDAFSNEKRNGMLRQVDHIDENQLNNNIDNLQLLSNRKNVSKGKSKFRELPTGVALNKQKSNRYNAQIQINGVSKNLGNYPTATMAQLAYIKCLISNGISL